MSVRGVSHSAHKMVVSLAQDIRFQDKQKKLRKNLIVHKNVQNLKKRSVDMKKVNMEIIKEFDWGFIFGLEQFYRF